MIEISYNIIESVIDQAVRLRAMFKRLSEKYNEETDPKTKEEIDRTIRKYWAKLPHERHNKQNVDVLIAVKELGLTIVDTDKPL